MAVDAAGLEAAMAIKNRNQLMCSRTEDVREGMMVFIEKRPTNFRAGNYSWIRSAVGMTEGPNACLAFLNDSKSPTTICQM